MIPLWRAARVLLGLILKQPILGTSVIPILPDGQVILVRRRDTGLWSLPGGIVEWGEDISTSAQRELIEETGLTVVRIGRLVGVYSAPQRDPRFHSACISLEAYVQGIPRVGDPDEVTEVQAFARDSLLSLPMSHDHKHQLQDYLAGKTVLA